MKKKRTHRLSVCLPNISSFEYCVIHILSVVGVMECLLFNPVKCIIYKKETKVTQNYPNRNRSHLYASNKIEEKGIYTHGGLFVFLTFLSCDRIGT